MLTATSSCLDLLGIDHVHFYVEDAAYWRSWFEYVLGFQAIASLTSSNGDTRTEILAHGSIQIRLSAPLHSNSSVSKFLQNHPPGIADIAFAVAQPNFGMSSINAWGDLTHQFVSRNPLDYANRYKTKSLSSGRTLPIFTHIDHAVLNVPVGEMWSVAQWYEQNMGLQLGDRFHIQTQHSALKSVVMTSQDRRVQIPINEPSSQNSQIQEFLDYNRGAGIQHLALHTDDIFSTVQILKQRGLKFLETSPPILQETQDSFTGQTLLQIFTQPIFDQPTFFFEIIQRQNQAQGFGEGNFQALFEAIEREQMTRSNH